MIEPQPPKAPSPRSGPPADPSPLRGRDLLTLAGLDRGTLRSLFELAGEMKRDLSPFRASLAGRTVVMFFEKPSLRTRVTFETGIARLGGHAIYMDQSGSRLGERESVRDLGRNLERWVQGVVARVFSQKAIEELAGATSIPVINALSDRFHPCQALADCFTLADRVGDLRGFRLAYIGDGNNVCHSLMHGAAALGVRMTVITPQGCEPAADVLAECRAAALATGGEVSLTHEPGGVKGHDAVYTDVWTSMGQAADPEQRERLFGPFQVNRALMDLAGPRALFLHCLPAHRGQEVTDEVMDSARSIVFDQAENRLHVQNAVMHRLLGG